MASAAVDPLSRVFSALADPTRRDMVARLTVADATVNELAAPYDVSVQAVSKHLKVLEDAGLVSRTKEAQRRPVHLEAEVFDLMTTWIERYRRQAEERYQRLDALLADAARRDRRRSTVNEAEIIVDEKVPTVTIIREFDAPVEKVFRAHVEPELFVQWNWPDGYEVRFDHFDCRTGGAYRITMSGRGHGGQRPRLVPRRASPTS